MREGGSGQEGGKWRQLLRGPATHRRLRAATDRISVLPEPGPRSESCSQLPKALFSYSSSGESRGSVLYRGCAQKTGDVWERRTQPPSLAMRNVAVSQLRASLARPCHSKRGKNHRAFFPLSSTPNQASAAALAFQVSATYKTAWLFHHGLSAP